MVRGKIHESRDPSRNYNTLSGFKIAGSGGSLQLQPVLDYRTEDHHLSNAYQSMAMAIKSVGPSAAAAPDRGGEDGFVPLETDPAGPE